MRGVGGEGQDNVWSLGGGVRLCRRVSCFGGGDNNINLFILSNNNNNNNKS
jgi:hypothetical protein